MSSTLPRRIRLAAVLVAAAAMALLLSWPVAPFFLTGQTDFVQLYTGAKLAATGRLYDADANYQWHERLFGVRFPAVLHSRPAFYAFLLQPLGWLPYKVAYWLFVLLNAAAAAWVFRRILAPNSPAAVWGLFYPAAYLAILWGQDVWLAAALFGASVLMLRQGRDVEAGLVMSLCAIKPHLFVLVPLALLARRRWRALAGGAAGAAALLLLSFAGGGPDWVAPYWKLLSSPVIHRDLGGMPNLQALSSQLGRPPLFLPVAAAAVTAAAAWICIRSRTAETALAAALTGSYLISYHAYPQDALTLLLAFALLPPAALRGWSKPVWSFLVSPVPLLCVLLGSPWQTVLPASAALALASLLAVRTAPPRGGGWEGYPEPRKEDRAVRPRLPRAEEPG